MHVVRRSPSSDNRRSHAAWLVMARGHLISNLRGPGAVLPTVDVLIGAESGRPLGYKFLACWYSTTNCVLRTT
jgi:hypothetical protein